MADDFKEEAENWFARVALRASLVGRRAAGGLHGACKALALWQGFDSLARHSPEGIRLDEGAPLSACVARHHSRVRVLASASRKLSGMDEDTASKAAAANHRRGFDWLPLRRCAREARSRAATPCTSVRLRPATFRKVNLRGVGPPGPGATVPSGLIGVPAFRSWYHSAHHAARTAMGSRSSGIA